MNNINDPKYDTDLVTVRYLRQVINKSSKETDEKFIKISKTYGAPPSPPYYLNDLLTYNNKIFKCTNQKLIGNFSWSDWKVVATDDTTINNFIDGTYSTDKLELQEQIDGKVETHYQANDPSENWTTDIIKAKHIGDYWYNTSNNTQHRYSQINTNPITYGWKNVDVPITVYDQINTKKSIYTIKPSSYKQNDLWIIESSLSDDDLPVGTEENPIAKGDWVFATQDSTIYNKSHWVKRDEDVSMEYLENHYYTKTEADRKYTTTSDVTSAIKKAKDEIELEVSQTYTTKEDTESIINDYDEQIGTITDTVETHGSQIANLSIENGRINNSISSINNTISTINGDLENLDENIETIQRNVSTLQTSSDYAINIAENIQQNGVSQVDTLTGFIFNLLGLTLDKSDAPTKSLLNEAGLEIMNKLSSDLMTLFYSGYVNSDIANKVAALENYLNQTVTYTDNLIFSKYLSSKHMRMEDVEHEVFGKGLGFFKVGDDN